MTMTHIETVTVGSGGAASIAFSAIAGDFTDLVLVYSLRNSTNTNYQTMSFNGSTSNFTQRQLDGEGSGSGTSASRTDSVIRLTAVPSVATASTFSSAQIYIPNYTASVNKSFSVDGVTENNATQAFQVLIAGLWSQTAAITSITLTSPANFVEHSSASLFGITAGSDGIVSVS